MHILLFKNLKKEISKKIFFVYSVFTIPTHIHTHNIIHMIRNTFYVMRKNVGNLF